MQTSVASFELPSHYSPAEDDRLLSFLKGNSEVPVRVDAAHLNRLDGLLLELLLTAARQLRAKGLGYSVDGFSTKIIGELAVLGVRQDELQGDLVH